jgi:hypothetical protein
MIAARAGSVLKDTADIRAKLLDVWKQIDEKTISSSEARLHISVARAILDTLKVEMAAAHLARTEIPAVPIRERTPLRLES